MYGFNKSMKILLIKLLVIFFSVIILSLGIDYIYRQTYHLKYETPNNVFILPEIPEKYELVRLGNSHSQDGITFERYSVKSLSLASIAQTFDYDLAYLKMHARQIKEGAVIIISASPISFSSKMASVGDSLQTNYYDGRITPFLIPHIKIGDYLQSRIFPFCPFGISVTGKTQRNNCKTAVKRVAVANQTFARSANSNTSC